MEFLSESTQQDITEAVQDIIEDYIETNALLFSKKDYISIIVDHVSSYVDIIAEQEEWYNNEGLHEWIEQICIDTLEVFSIPHRENSPYRPHEIDNETISRILEQINRKPVQKQRTMEWHMVRKNLFSASNIWKLFGTPSQYNSIIYEKCKELTIYKTEGDVLAPNARNWGIKYEPITAMIYEDKNKTIVKTDYGCIPHETLPVGASPDGIVCDKSSDKYGHMVEIKNIYNREIDGIPSEEYWIQMQTQLEVCGLEICDFVETRIKEYETYEEFCADESSEYKGISLFFIPRTMDNGHESHFEYMPLIIRNCDEYRKGWVNHTIEEKKDQYVLYNTSYWYLHQYSCVEILRNDMWFSSAVPIIKESWDVVIKEREEGSEHRAPQKRNTQSSSNNETIMANGCPSAAIIHVVKLDESSTV